MPADIFEAIADGDEELVRELIERRPEAAEERDAEGVSAVRRAIYAGRDAVATLLLDANPALDVFDAAATGRTRGLTELLEADPDLARGWSSDGFTALHLAAVFGHHDAVDALLRHGADPNARQGGGFTPLHAAAQNGDRESVDALLESGADPAVANDDGKTPGDLARAAGHDELGELLA